MASISLVCVCCRYDDTLRNIWSHSNIVKALCSAVLSTRNMRTDCKAEKHVVSCFLHRISHDVTRSEHSRLVSAHEDKMGRKQRSPKSCCRIVLICEWTVCTIAHKKSTLKSTTLAGRRERFVRSGYNTTAADSDTDSPYLFLKQQTCFVRWTHVGKV